MHVNRPDCQGVFIFRFKCFETMGKDDNQVVPTIGKPLILRWSRSLLRSESVSLNDLGSKVSFPTFLACFAFKDSLEVELV
jgi:hypothetical protein